MPAINSLVVAHIVVTEKPWRVWSFEPGVVIPLALLATAYGVGVARLWRIAGRGQGIRGYEVAAFVAGWLALVIALVSPLDALSARLFSAHMVQHELLMIVAAPLIVLGAPMIAMLWLLPLRGRRTASAALHRRRVAAGWAILSAPVTVWLLHGIVLWVWHVPALFQATLDSELVHAAQHLCFFGTASLFWWGISHGRYGRLGYGAAVLYVFATSVHSGVLGALLTLSPRVWYPLYASTTLTFGVTPLEDQQLAGLVMWVPASVIFAGIGLTFFALWLRESERRSRFTTVCLLLFVVIQASACAKSPSLAIARLLEGAASWSASVQFAAEMERGGRVPRAYMRELLATAARDVAVLRDQMLETKGVDAQTRSRAAVLGGCLVSALQRAGDGTEIDERMMRDLEMQLRELARLARDASGRASL
jgi:cytochrome c oxidase assembly factor CtaG